MLVEIVLPLLLSLQPDRPGPDEVDAKTLEAIVREIELAPSFYANVAPPANVRELPRFSAKKLSGYKVAPDQSLDKERKRWKGDKKQYAKDFPLRAAIFEAAEQTQTLPIPISPRAPVTPKGKADLLLEAESLGRRAFKLEQTLARLMKAADKRDMEKSKRWQANFDFAQARLQINIVFLLEYNFTIGQIRADALPALGPDDGGWKLTAVPKVTVTEKKAKDLAKSAKQIWQRIQQEHPDTPWAYFAQRESERSLGMQWAPNKK